MAIPSAPKKQPSATAARLGKRLCELRLERGLTQGDLEAKTGILKSHISRIENGHRTPSLETVRRLATALEVPLYALFYSLENPPSPSRTASGRALKPLFAKVDDRKDFLASLQQIFPRLTDSDRKLLLTEARKLARRK
ncbi:MAG TPA: helix-turn-helix transcriptional regulator [Terriglobia bacterium]|nr:helix-turn-helix transcriptional regulator [Terriglobia bacterium]